MGKKLLIISTQLAGGCFHYSNEIISHWFSSYELVMPIKTEEKHNLKPDWTFQYYGVSKLSRMFSLFFTILRVIFNAIIKKKYCGLLLFGTTKWDYIVLKCWAITHLPSFSVIHDGKMHVGEQNKKNQKMIVGIMKKSTHLIFLSNYVHNLVKDNFGIDKPFFIAPHGLIDYGPLPDAPLKTDRPTILFLGRVVKYKGVDLLLEAMRKVPDNLYDKLIIAGKWSYINKSEYNHDKIEIIDKFLSQEEILHYISLSDVMIFPYIEATQSGVVTLAINYLRPSISTEVGALKEQFSDEVTIFVKPDVDELSEAIKYLLQHPELLEKMKYSLLKLRESYSWEKIAKDLNYKILAEC